MRLLHLFIILPVLTMVLSGCKFFPEEDLPDREEVRPPPISEVPDQEDRFFYIPSPDLPSIEGSTPASAPVCDLEGLTHETEPDDVEGRNIDFVSDTVSITEELDPQDEARDADYLHLTDIDIIRTSGSSLDFIEWVRIWIVSDVGSKIEVAWGNNEGAGNEIDLRVDGSVDLRHYLAEGATLEGEVRASAPPTTTWIKARLSFLKFSNCETP